MTDTVARRGRHPHPHPQIRPDRPGQLDAHRVSRRDRSRPVDRREDHPGSAELTRLEDDVRNLLARYAFDSERFAWLRERLRAGLLSPTANVVSGTVEPPHPQDLTPLPLPGTPEYHHARELGMAALRSGSVAAVVLNGGMATRFGGRVKGIVEAVDGRSFLQIKLEQVARLSATVGAPLPCAVMTSFATDAATRDHLARQAIAEPVYFSQSVSLRLTPDGRLLRTADGRVSPYAPGHGDLLPALRRSGTLHRLRASGIRLVMVSNVDNLAATPDPVILGMHLASGRPMTAEVAPATGSPGGAPARVNARTVLVEGMRFPAGFDRAQLPVTNVNTVTFDLDALDRDYPLTWLYVEKTVQGRTAVQLEQLFHEVSAFVPTTFLTVPASGPHSRFIPVKTPADLVAAQPLLRAALGRPVPV